MFKTAKEGGRPLSTTWMCAFINSCYILFLLLFIIGILLIVGVFGNDHENVIRFMNCDSVNSAVSCARVYGFRAEGVVLIIISFFALMWGVVLSIVCLITYFKRRGPSHVTINLSRPHHEAQYATSEA